MTKRLYTLSAAQWEVLALFQALEKPTPLHILRNLITLEPDVFLDVINQAKKKGWLKQTDIDEYRLAPHLPFKIRKELKEFNNPSHISALLNRVSESGFKERLNPDMISSWINQMDRKDEFAL